MDGCHDLLSIATGVEHVAQAGFGIAQHRAIALQGPNGE
jgi:hypothetical protein